MAQRRVFVVWVSMLTIQMTSFPDIASGQSCPYLDLALVLPTSSDSASWSQMVSFVNSFLSAIDIGGTTSIVRVAIVKYTGTSQIEFPLTQYQTKADILAAINQMQPLSGNGKNVADAEQQLRTVFASPTPRTGARMTAIIFFDGPSDNRVATLTQAQGLNNLGVYVLGVGIGQVDNSEVQGVSTQASDNVVNVYTVSGYDQLQGSVAAFNMFLCNSRKPICSKQADVVLILDQSSSIAGAPGGYNNWELIKNFTNNIISAFPISPDLTRVGLVIFSSSSSIVFNLNTYTTIADLQSAVSKLQMQGGETNIYAAFRDALNLLTTPSLGARPGVKKMAFLITDGKANRDTDKTQAQVNATKSAGVEIFCIGMTNNVDVNELTGIASQPTNAHYFFATNFGSLGDVLDMILGETCLEIQTTTTTNTATKTLTSAITWSSPTTTSTKTSTTTSTTTIATTTAMTTTAANTTTPNPSATTTTTTTPSTTTTNTTTLSPTIPTNKNVIIAFAVGICGGVILLVLIIAVVVYINRSINQSNDSSGRNRKKNLVWPRTFGHRYILPQARLTAATCDRSYAWPQFRLTAATFWPRTLGRIYVWPQKTYPDFMLGW